MAHHLGFDGYRHDGEIGACATCWADREKLLAELPDDERGRRLPPRTAPPARCNRTAFCALLGGHPGPCASRA